MNTNIIRVFSLIICLGWSLLSYTQDCGPQAGGSELEGGKVIISYGATTNSVTPKVASNILLGQPVIGQSNTTKVVAEYGFYAQFLLPPLPATVTASQGELLDRIQVSWAIDPLGSSPNEGFNIFRDGVFIDNVGPQVRNYNDFNVIAGRPYIYAVSGINKFGEGSAGEGLGFQVPNGVVTGWVSTLNSRPVPNAQVTLLPMQGFSTKYGIDDGAIAIKDDGNPFLPTAGADWTMTFWMKTTTSSSNADVIHFNGSTLEINALPGANGISVTQGVNSLTSNFASNEWHHVTLAYEAVANTGRLYIDGALGAQSTMSNVSSPDSLYIGKVLEANGWSGLIDEFRIYHTVLDELDLGMVMEGTASSTTPDLKHYWKFDEELGEKSFDIINRHQLYFCGAQFDEDRPPVRTAAVTNEDGYYLIEGVSYGTGTTFIAEPEKNFYLHRSLEFNGNDHVEIPNFALPPKSTIELWVNNTNAGSAQTILSKKEGSNTFKIYSELQGVDNQVKVDINGNIQTIGNLATGFNHLAFTIDSVAGQINGYINGISQPAQSYTIPSNWSDTTYHWYAGANSNGISTTDYFNGLIDEIAVYDTLLQQSTIMAHTQNARDMTEEGLIVFFPIDEGNGNRVNSVGSVFLEFGKILGAVWSNFAANQETTPHEFTPKTRQVTLNPSVTSVDQVDFTDLSTIPVSGYVRFQGTECFQPNVEILVNGSSFSPPVYTDDEGKFLVDFDPGFSGILMPKYVKFDSNGNEDTEIEGHTFSPASWELTNVTGPIAGILFNNTVKRKISGKVAGGLCGLPILENLGMNQGTICRVKVSTPDGCLERIYEFGAGEENGEFEFDNLPPVEKMVLSIIEHSEPVIKTYFEVSGGSELDISLKDTIKNMIYFAPPEITIISGLEKYPDCDLIIVEQGSPQTIILEMQEIYIGGVCKVDTGNLSIINGLSDEGIDTTLSDSFTYTFKVGEPNPSPPYLKTLQIVGTSLAGRESSVSKQAIVTGIRKKENTFTSKLPNIPMLVLRDPPGDGSSAYFEKGETICQTTEFSYLSEGGFGVGGEYHLGGNVEVSIGLGMAVINNFGPIFDTSIDGEFTWNTVTDSSWQQCFTTNERIATSDGDLLPGKASDVFMGLATNIIFGFADAVYFDPELCLVQDSVILNVEGDSDYESTYLYSRFQIENYVIPNLYKIASQEQDITLKKEYENSAMEWRGILAESDTIVLDSDYQDCHGCGNISFSAGVEYEYSFTSDTLDVSSSISGNGQNGIEETNIGFEYNMNGFILNAKIFAGQETSNGAGDENSNFVTTGYILSDDDPGDAFSVDVGLDSIYKTPIFKIKAGQSACPWEVGTANREGPNLKLADGSVSEAINIPANQAAVFKFNLGNLSATNEDVTYGFTSIAASNPDGAIIKLNGQPLNYVEQYTVPYGGSIPITVTVERGPIEYDYDSLIVVQMSECEYDRNLGLSILTDFFPDLNDSIPDLFSAIPISVSFIRPCSEVNINVPEQNWVVITDDPNQPGTLRRTTVSGYDLNSHDFQLIRMQYRQSDGDGAWINMPTNDGIYEAYNPNWSGFNGSPPNNTLPNEPDTLVLGSSFTQFLWETSGLIDGNYEVHAWAVCSGDASDKPGFSEIIKGRIDRQPPELLGVPQPSDGVYHVGDEISFAFNQEINCNKLIQADLTQPNNVGLYDATTDELIDVSISCFDNKLILDPNFVNEVFENKIIRAELHNIKDLVGNNMDFEKWEFYVDRNELAWLTDSIQLTKYDDETKAITAKIQNRGGYPVPYTMQDLPDWVHVSPNSGTLVANEIEEITFTVDENVPLGYLSDSIVMHTETGQNPFFMGGDEVLNMAARVICRPDAWIVNPDNFNASNFSFSMNFNLSLNIEGTPTEDVQDIVGAYVDGQIRGVSRVQYNPLLNNYLAFITVYSNIASGEIVEFQIWDASECKLFAPVIESFTFNANDIVGSPTNPQVLHTTGKVLRKIFVHPGWNWISMNLDLEDASVNTALSSLSNPEDALIKGQTNFSSYSTGLESWFGDLDSVSYLDLYQYNSVNYDSISMVGTLVDPNTEIPLTSGWNWIGYIPNEKLPIAQALSSLTPSDGDLIKSQISFAQYVDNIGWIGNLHYLDAPNGYLLKLSNPDILIYPDPQSLLGSTGLTTFTHSSILGGKGEKKESTTRSADHWEVDASLYENSMNVIGIVVKSEGDNILDDFDEVAAFVGNEVRGHAKTIYIPAIDSYMIFMTIYANQDGELLTFKFFDSSNNQEFDLEEKSGFVVNSVLGEVDDPKPLHIATSTSVSDLNGEEKMSIFPNPFSRTLTINFHSENADEIEMSIKDVYGNTVEKSLRKMSAGMNVLEWTPSANILQGSYIVTLKDSDSYYIKKVIYVK